MSDQIAFIGLSIDQFLRTGESGQKAKKKIHKLAKKYGPILDKFSDVIFITDTAGHFIFVNKASEQRTGIPTETFIGRHFLELIDPKYHEFIQSTFQKTISGERVPPPIEMERQTASGEKITMEINSEVLYEDKVPVGFLGVSRDVTDRKRAEEALKSARDELEMRVKERTAELRKTTELLKKDIEERKQAEEKLKESEEKYRSLFENSGDAIFIVDTETGIILDANRQSEILTGSPDKRSSECTTRGFILGKPLNIMRKKFKNI